MPGHMRNRAGLAGVGGAPAPHPGERLRRVGPRLGCCGQGSHGGRQLDTAPSPIDMLPSIRAVAPNTPIMVDSGVRRGSDIVIAMCLGARFAFFGRPTLYGAAVAGRKGVGKTIGLVRAEIDLVMAQIGCTRLDALHAGYLRRAGADYTALANVGQNPGPAA